MRRRFPTAVAAVVSGVAGVLIAVPTAASPAAAAPVACTATDAQIYTSPDPATLAAAAPGALLACRTVTLTQVPGNIPMTAWKVQYASRDARDQPIAVSGTVAVPTAAWTGGGTRPVIAFNPGTLGLGPQCAFSKQLAGAYQDMYEGDQIAASLRAGYAVAATDGVGYLNGQVHHYVVGRSMGHALLDIARTTSQVPGAGLAAGTKVGIWGYSEGGAASLWAAQLAASYAPDVKVAGAAAGGVPGDLKLVAAQLNGGLFAGFMTDAVIGISAAYPALPFDSLMNAQGRQAVATAKQVCLIGTLGSFLFANISGYTNGGLSLEQLYNQAGTDGRTWGQVLDDQKLGVNIGTPLSSATYKIGFPVFQYRGVLEEIINTQATDNTRAAYCRAGVTTQWNAGYLGEHLTTDNLAIGDVVRWLGDRFRGLPTAGNC
jgi:hypothetical protein